MLFDLATTVPHLIVGLKGATVIEGNLVFTNVVHGFWVESSADTVHYLPSSQETVPLDSCELMELLDSLL